MFVFLRISKLFSDLKLTTNFQIAKVLSLQNYIEFDGKEGHRTLQQTTSGGRWLLTVKSLLPVHAIFPALVLLRHECIRKIDLQPH